MAASTYQRLATLLVATMVIAWATSARATESTTRHTRTVRMTVTAYCACTKCCGKNARGITASGKPVSHNGGRFVAADPRVLKLGSKVFIPGYSQGGQVEVIDTGGAIKGNRLDVFFPTHQAALQWGRQTLDVVVME